MTSPLSILARTFRPIAIPRRSVPGCRLCRVPISGVYLLVTGSEIVYVGKSRDIEQRLLVHGHERRHAPNGRDVDRAFHLPLPGAVISFYESALLRALQPRHNKLRNAKTDRKFDAEILFGLGLRDELLADEVAA